MALPKAPAATLDDLTPTDWTLPTFHNVHKAAEHNRIPEDGCWEYWIRKSSNNGKGDYVFNSMNYVPISSTIPVPAKDDNPTWVWTVRRG